MPINNNTWYALRDYSKNETLFKTVRDGEFNTIAKFRPHMPEGSLIFVVDKQTRIPQGTTCVITKPELVEYLPENYAGGIGTTDDPKYVFYEIHKSYKPKPTKTYKTTLENSIIYFNSVISPTACIGANCTIGGEGFTVWRGEVIFHRGATIIEDYVTIQNNVCIDRGFFPDRNTIIGHHTAIDNLVSIAHGVQIGEYTNIAAGAVISGGVTIGKNVWIGPNATIKDNITIGDNAFISLGAIVLSNVPDNAKAYCRPAKILL